MHTNMHINTIIIQGCNQLWDMRAELIITTCRKFNNGSHVRLAYLVVGLVCGQPKLFRIQALATLDGLLSFIIKYVGFVPAYCLVKLRCFMCSPT